jgi:single-strand DNA-binding protein
MYAKTIILGRLGGDPEMRFTANGKAVCNFNVATDQGYGDNKKTVWYRVTAWEKTAEICNQYLKKGREVFIEGEIAEPVPWQAKDGSWKATLELTARNVTFIGGRSNVEDTPVEQTNRPQSSRDEETMLDSEEIPF